MSAPDLTISRRLEADALILEMTGHLIKSALPDVTDAIERAQRDNPSEILLDLAGIDAIDSQGIGALVAWHRHFVAGETGFRILRPSENILRALRVCNLNNLLEFGPPPADERIRASERGRSIVRSYLYAEQILSALGEGLVGLDAEGAIVFVNPSAERLSGVVEHAALGKSFVEAFEIGGPDGEAARDIESNALKSALASDRPETFAASIAPSGRALRRPMRITVTPIFSDGRLDGRLIGLADNAAARRLERRLYAGQKVESLGAMAGGLAHDFNNLLTGIFSSLSLALSEVPESAPVRSSLDAIRDAAAGMTALTDQLALFAGRRPPSVETFELSGLVREIEDLLRSAAGRRTRLTFELDRSPLIVRADASQVRHAIANLIANARENLQDGAGAIVLRTGSLSPERAFFEVSDSGEGLSDRDLEGVFEPFRGASGQQGSGIALPVVQSIARSHGGEAEVRSVPGKGTTFRVTLPKTEPAERAAKASARSVAAGPFRVGGAVLIVDDESVVRSGVAAMLESLGFETIEAKEGREGVDLFERNAERIVLVILDLTMPVMDGAEAFERIKAIRSTVPVVIMSGYAEREVSESFEGKRVAAFLHKPFGVDELGRAIRSMQP